MSILARRPAVAPARRPRSLSWRCWRARVLFAARPVGRPTASWASGPADPAGLFPCGRATVLIRVVRRLAALCPAAPASTSGAGRPARSRCVSSTPLCGVSGVRLFGLVSTPASRSSQDARRQPGADSSTVSSGRLPLRLGPRSATSSAFEPCGIARFVAWLREVCMEGADPLPIRRRNLSLAVRA